MLQLGISQHSNVLEIQLVVTTKQTRNTFLPKGQLRRLNGFTHYKTSSLSGKAVFVKDGNGGS